MVLSGAAETTVPCRSWRRPRSCSGFGSRVIGLRSADGTRCGLVFFGRSERGRRFFLCFGWETAAGVASAGASSGAVPPRARRPPPLRRAAHSLGGGLGVGLCGQRLGLVRRHGLGFRLRLGGRFGLLDLGHLVGLGRGLLDLWLRLGLCGGNLDLGLLGVASSAGSSGVSSISFTFSVSSGISLLSSVALVLDGQDAGDLALGMAQACAVLEHAGRRLEVQVEELLAGLGHLAAELVVGQGS